MSDNDGVTSQAQHYGGCNQGALRDVIGLGTPGARSMQVNEESYVGLLGGKIDKLNAMKTKKEMD